MKESEAIVIWNTVDKLPKKGFGWYGVAILPVNHSGNEGHENHRVDLAGDNLWRESYGFTKAWLNNGQWFEADMHGYSSREITHLVTHWSMLPKVPIIETVHNGKEGWLSKPMDLAESCEISHKAYLDNNREVDLGSYQSGYMDALMVMGVLKLK